jgi:hypothetical protein
MAMVTACGAETVNLNDPDGGKTSSNDAPPTVDADAGPKADSAPYEGLILAVATTTITATGSTDSYALVADFGPDQYHDYPAAPDPLPGDAGTGPCLCTTGVAASANDGQPGAGTITLEAGGATLATMTQDGDSSGLQGTLLVDVPTWQYWASDYGAPSRPWSPGAPLQVSGGGASGQVAAFSATMKTGALFVGVGPSMAGGTVDIDTSQDFEVSWTPEAQPDGGVFLALYALGDATTEALLVTCACSAPDSAGKLTVPPAALSSFPKGGLSTGTIALSRLTTSKVVSGNVSLELASEVAVQAGVVFK